MRRKKPINYPSIIMVRLERGVFEWFKGYAAAIRRPISAILRDLAHKLMRNEKRRSQVAAKVAAPEDKP